MVIAISKGQLPFSICSITQNLVNCTEEANIYIYTLIYCLYCGNLKNLAIISLDIIVEERIKMKLKIFYTIFTPIPGVMLNLLLLL